MVYALNTPENFQQHILSPNDIFWLKRDGSRVLICRAGDLIDHERLRKFENIEFVLKVDLEKINRVYDCLLQLREIVRPKDKMKVVAQVRRQWSQWFDSGEKLTPLELVILNEQLMGDYLRVHAHIWANASISLFHRSCIAGLMSACGAIALGYASWPYIEDVWRVSFSHSASFGLSGMSGQTLSCLEYARQHQGTNTIKVEPLPSSFPSVAAVFDLVHSPKEKVIPSEMNDMERWFGHIQKVMPWNQELLQNFKWWNEFFKDDYFFVLEKMGEVTNELRREEESAYIEFEI